MSFEVTCNKAISEENESLSELLKVIDGSGRRLLINKPELLSQTSLSLKGESIDIMGLCDVLRKNMTLISSLDMSNQGLEDSVSKPIELMLKTNTTITSLNLSNNPLGDACGRAIGRGLEQNTTLVSLGLSENQRMGDDGICSIAEGLKRNRSLKTLGFWVGSVRNAGAVAMADMLKVNTTLSHVNFWGPFGDEGVCALCKAASTSSSLGQFGLHAEAATNVGLKAVCDLVRENKSISICTIERITMKGEGLQWFCDALKANSTIKKLHLGNCVFEEQDKKAIIDVARSKAGSLSVAFVWKKENGWVYEKL